MMKLKQAIAVGAMLTAGLSVRSEAADAPASAKADKTNSAHQFAQLSDFDDPRLSPDGKWIAARVRIGGREQVSLTRVADQAIKLIQIPDKVELRFFRWAGSGRVLLSLGILNNVEGVELHATRLFVYDLAAGSLHYVGDKHAGLYGDDILWVDPNGKWVELSLQDALFSPLGVRRFDLDTNLPEVVEKPRDDVLGWYADDDGNVRMALTWDGDQWHIEYRRQPGDKLQSIARGTETNFDQLDDAVRIVSGTDDGYIVSAEKTGRAALYHYNFKTRATGELIFESKTNDVTDIDIDAHGHGLRWVSFTDDRDRIEWFDPVMKKQQAMIDRALPDTINRVISASSDQGTMLIESDASDEPGTYYIYHVAEHRMEVIGGRGVDLDRKLLSPTKAVTYKARDGLVIPAYLTLPTGHDPRKLPLVIMPHGGPYGIRDKLEYNPEVQYLASRGYAVLQPNYRGSSSYGRDFDKAGDGQIGRRMQDDIDDGMDWLVAQGIADPKRVCLDGASYGGYAALWGATRNPERYRCAASFAGVTDFNRQLRYDAGFFDSKGARSWKARVRGDKGFNLDTVSPLPQAASLRVPVLLGHGDADTNVPYSQSKLYAQALEKLGKPHEFITFKDEGHGFAKPDDFETWLTRLGTFLEKYNPTG